MLEPLETPATVARRRKLIDAYDAQRVQQLNARDPGLSRLLPGMTIELDPETLAEVARWRVRTRDRSANATHFELQLVHASPLWKAAVEDGLSLNVEIERPSDNPDGANAGDEVDLRDLPKNPRTTFGTTTTLGKRVAFRQPLWDAIFSVIAPTSGHAVAVARSPAVDRIRERMVSLLGGAHPDSIRRGVLVEYDHVTDHALVRTRLHGQDIYIHTSLGWTMEDSMPPGPTV